ncbi:hypothetical protein Taro_050571 [Colocasia esculenta]|uniref:Uncharacterized protein n=1 Tax=Colocasia esculenta TaxID=4460 RepID=A0A843XDS7_COLES|nr:hypothetical protein [Colocasia esculenta]
MRLPLYVRQVAFSEAFWFLLQILENDSFLELWLVFLFLEEPHNSYTQIAMARNQWQAMQETVARLTQAL